MTLNGTFRFTWREVAANPARSGVSIAGIALGVAVLLTTVGLGLGARNVLLTEVIRALPVDLVEAVPRSVDLGLIELGGGGILGGGVELNDDTLVRLSKLDGVVAAYPKLEVSVPMGARGGARLFGRRLYTDLFMTGLPESLIQPEAGEDFRSGDGAIPVVISDQLIQIFNSSVAPSLGIPKLSAELLRGLEFDIIFGRSLMLGRRGARHEGKERARIVGSSRYALRLGVTVPLKTARQLTSKYGDARAAGTYRSVLLRAASAADVPRVIESVRAAGLEVDESAKTAGELMTAAAALAGLFGLLVLGLAGFNIAHSFFASLSERRRELAILRAVGATRHRLVLLTLLQATLLGLAGGIMGLFAGHIGIWLIDQSAALLLPNFPFKPESFFMLPVWLDGMALIAALGASLFGAAWPAVRASRVSLTEVLSDL